MGSPLDNLSIVLVRGRTPGNIGSVARCMMNMGLSKLVLVRPPNDTNGEMEKFAAGADRIIANAARFDTLREALAGCRFVAGTSRRRGRQRKNVRTPREAAAEIVPLLGAGEAAVVFGSEVDGLEMTDLALCHEIISIPSHDAFPSLNLSHAVMVVAYELFLASCRPEAAPGQLLASVDELEGLYGHLESGLDAGGFFVKEGTERTMFSLRQIFGRARLRPKEVGLLRGVLSSLWRPVPPRKK